ncbi:MAG: alpha/beta fold hydrolase [Caulobacteraceae bacterium]|nr:alpha/beta fold hydrolase [Caulobacteraceae bacterium]
MDEEAGFLEQDGARIAWRRIAGAAPAAVWLGGFHSDMTGTKAEALADWAKTKGRAFLRFDYFAHGQSEGDFAQGTITRWRADALAVIDGLTEGPLVLVGSSMGGWIACLAALTRPERIKAMVLIAPAADFTERLMWDQMDASVRHEIESLGIWSRPSEYGELYVITRTLIEDGRRWQILPGPVGIKVPVRILQGGADPDVPWRHALALAEALETEDLVFTLIRDGDHRLSRETDIRRLVAAVEEVG